MKLRIKGDSLRLRLTQGEVRELAERGAVADHVHFAPGVELTYGIRRDEKVSTLTAHYGGNSIEIRVPDAVAREWCATDMVTLEYSTPTAQGHLRLVVEKDFSCLVPRVGEDETDHLAHPLAPPGG